MNAILRKLTVAGVLAIGTGLGLEATSARAQGYAPVSPPAYYYPAAGHYATTLGTVYIPTPGYYHNVPARFAAPTSYVYAPTTRPGWTYGYGDRSSAGYRARRGGGGPNNPPYYSSALHSLHGRGIDSGRHGR